VKYMTAVVPPARMKSRLAVLGSVIVWHSYPLPRPSARLSALRPSYRSQQSEALMDLNMRVRLSSIACNWHSLASAEE